MVSTRKYLVAFEFVGQTFRESTKTKTKELARRAERKRRLALEESYNGVVHERPRPVLFSVAGEEWLEVKRGTLAPKSYGVEVYSLKHLTPVFGRRLVSDIDAAAIARYVGDRRREQAADKSIKLELGTLRGMLKRAKCWATIVESGLVPTLTDRTDVGRAISAEEEQSLVAVCRTSRSRGLATAVTIALNTGMREGEIRCLQWWQVDFDARTRLGLGDDDVDDLAVAALAELDDAVRLGEERVVAADPDVEAGVPFGAALAHDDRARRHYLAAVTLPTQTLRVGVASVTG